LSGPDLLARVSADSVAYWRTLGIEVRSIAGPGIALLRLAMRPELGTRRPDVLHGGAIASLIDAASGAAVATLREESDSTWAGQATLDLNVTFLSAATGDVEAEGRILRATRTLAFTHVDVRDQAGRLIAVGRATYTIIRQ
jgi:uncharacterized protein (TIGR00369 family)